jgi:aminopeptidase N
VLACVAALAGVAVPAAAAPWSHATAGSDGAGDPYYPTDGNGGYDVSDYHVAIRYDPATHHLQGDTTITAKATESLSQFDLDFTGLTVRSVTVDGEPANNFHHAERHELVIVPEHNLRRGGQFTVEVTYDGIPTPIKDPALGNVGWQYSVDGGAFAAGEPHSATTWYPVNDTPMDKASFHLSATVPDGWKVIGNGLQGTTREHDGWSTFHWNEDTPIASYLTTVGIDKWVFKRSHLADGTPVVSAFAPNATKHTADESRLPEVLNFLASKFGPYPQDAAGGIFIADNIGFSLESQTRPIYGQWAGLGTIVHENAHQWFGDWVSVHHWADVCLNECFASYATWMWSHAKDGLNLDDYYRTQVRRHAGEKAFWAQRLYDPGKGKEFTGVYYKGPMALHALRRQIGDRAFDLVLHLWPKLHAHGNASWQDFEQLVARVSGQDLHGFFQAWFHGTTKPAPKYLWPGTLHP